MKKFLPFVWIVVIMFLLAACSIAPASDSNLGEVNGSQLYAIGLFASVIVYALKVLSKRFPKVVISIEVLSVLLYVAALGLAFYWGGLTIPAFAAFNDPLTFVTAFFGFITALLVALGPSVGFATLIYNLLLKRVLDAGAKKVGLVE